MQVKENTQPAIQLRTLALFRPLLEEVVVAKLLRLLETDAEDLTAAVDAYCDFAAALYAEGGDLGAYLLRVVTECENPVVDLAATGAEIPGMLNASLQRELAIFTQLASVDPARLLPTPFGEEALPDMPMVENTPQDFLAHYRQRLAQVCTRGFGIFAAWHMFTLTEGKNGAKLLPVKNPDPQRLDELTGYDRERSEILLNTRALLSALPANNILLYGDAGTGKSSTVKAIANEYHTEGLRLVEVRKNQLYLIPELMDKLADNPLKFILFIDDLSFPSDDKDFTALKAILEGNVAARPGNIVVYATSNRRHMVKERYADRMGDDMHLADTLEEEASLSARFGLTITFLKPDKDLYAEIVTTLAGQYGITTPTALLLEKAEAHAIRHGGRSPRTARQFVEYMVAYERQPG